MDISGEEYSDITPLCSMSNLKFTGHTTLPRLTYSLTLEYQKASSCTSQEATLEVETSDTTQDATVHVPFRTNVRVL